MIAEDRGIPADRLREFHLLIACDRLEALRAGTADLGELRSLEEHLREARGSLADLDSTAEELAALKRELYRTRARRWVARLQEEPQNPLYAAWLAQDLREGDLRWEEVHATG